jgi:hypothetical protein
MANYRINEKNKTISIGANITEAEKNALAIYISAGYTVRAKSEIKSAQAKKKADALPKKADIIKALEKANKKAELDEFNNKCDVKNGGNFFKARSWYLKEVAPTLEK